MSDLSSGTVAAWNTALSSRAAATQPYGDFVAASGDLDSALSGHATTLRTLRDAESALAITHGLWSSYTFSLLQSLQADFGLSLTPNQSPDSPSGTLRVTSVTLWQTYLKQKTALDPLMNAYVVAEQAYAAAFATLLAAFNAYVAAIPAWQDCDFTEGQAMADLLFGLATDCDVTVVSG